MEEILEINKAAQRFLSPNDIMYEIFRIDSKYSIKALRTISKITYDDKEPIVYFKNSASYCKLSSIEYNISEGYWYVYASNVNYESLDCEDQRSIEETWKMIK